MTQNVICNRMIAIHEKSMFQSASHQHIFGNVFALQTARKQYVQNWQTNANYKRQCKLISDRQSGVYLLHLAVLHSISYQLKILPKKQRLPRLFGRIQ